MFPFVFTEFGFVVLFCVRDHGMMGPMPAGFSKSYWHVLSLSSSIWVGIRLLLMLGICQNPNQPPGSFPPLGPTAHQMSWGGGVGRLDRSDTPLPFWGGGCSQKEFGRQEAVEGPRSPSPPPPQPFSLRRPAGCAAPVAPDVPRGLRRRRHAAERLQQWHAPLPRPGRRGPGPDQPRRWRPRVRQP